MWACESRTASSRGSSRLRSAGWISRRGPSFTTPRPEPDAALEHRIGDDRRAQEVEQHGGMAQPRHGQPVVRPRGRIGPVRGGGDAASDVLPAVSNGDARIPAGEGEAVGEMHVHAPVSIRVYLSGRRRWRPPARTIIGHSPVSPPSRMRVVLQRVSRASVTIEGRVAGAIGRGFCLLVGFTHSDTGDQVDWMAEKVAGLRLFADAEGKMNLGLAEVQGALLVISQFTLYGDAAKGRRPSFIDAARPETAIPLYERFVAALRTRGLRGGHRRVRRRHAGRDPQRRTRDPHPGPRMSRELADPRLRLTPPPAAARDAGHPGARGALAHSRGASAGRDAGGLRRAPGAREGAQRAGRLVLGADTTVVVAGRGAGEAARRRRCAPDAPEAAGPHPSGGDLGRAGGRRDRCTRPRTSPTSSSAGSTTPSSRPTSRRASRWTRRARTASRATARRWWSGSTATSSA